MKERDKQTPTNREKKLKAAAEEEKIRQRLR
jgi:hypothetical protein